MSYILDALRRADAERERDPARGIHAQPAAVIPTPARARLPGWAWPAAAALVVAAAAVVSWQREAPPAPAASVAVAPQVQPAVQPVAPAVPPVQPAVPAVAAAVMPPAPIVVEKVVRVVPAAPPAMTLKAPPPTAAAAAAPAVAAAKPAAAPASAASAESAMEHIYNVAELPLDVRNALPNLAITGGVHSPVPAQRMLIVGGQVMHEGAELAPGLVLEQIRPRGAVLKFRGYRYGVTY